MKRFSLKYIPLLAGALTVLASCEHKELCFDHDEHAPKSAVHIQAGYEQEWELTSEGGTDWESMWKEGFGMEYDELRPTTPEGLRIQFYHEDGTPTPRTGKILAATPMGRFGKSEELLGALLFLLSNDAAGFVTGVVIPVDGGFSAYSGV